jgi:membrane-associated phospholipid phosphatase
VERAPQSRQRNLSDSSDRRCAAYAIAFLLLLLVAIACAFNSHWIDRPIAKALNEFTRTDGFANTIAYHLTYPTLEGLAVVSLVWACWFSVATAELRARIIAGAFAAVLAGLVANYLHDALPTPPKPIFDRGLDLHLPSVFGDMATLRANSFPDSHTFPSERATLFAGLAITIAIVQSRIGVLALAFTFVVEFCRIYLGLHFFTDIVGSICLAAASVWLAQMRWGVRIGLWFVNWQRASAPSFYACAFLASYFAATTFQELRDLAALLRR